MARPGDYVPDVTEGITRVEDLPKPKIKKLSRNYRQRVCPRCGRSAGRQRVRWRTLHDLGDLVANRPVDLELTFSHHRCPGCGKYFYADTTDLADARSQYTRRVVHVAVRLVVEDGLPYRSASWHLWRDHRVFVPWGTIQEWVEATGEKR